MFFHFVYDLYILTYFLQTNEQIYYEVSRFLYFLINSCCFTAEASGLLLGSFFRMKVMKSRNSGDPIFITKSYVTILDKSYFFFILKGLSAQNNSQASVPMAQVSIFQLYIFPFKIYGERYKGVPQKVDLRSLEQKTDHPKSHILANPFEIKKIIT